MASFLIYFYLFDFIALPCWMQTISISDQSHEPCKQEAASPMSTKGLLLRGRDGTSYLKKMEGDKPDYLTIFSAFQLQWGGANLLIQHGGTCAGRKGGKVGDTPNRAQHHLGPVSPRRECLSGHIDRR